MCVLTDQICPGIDTELPECQAAGTPTRHWQMGLEPPRHSDDDDNDVDDDDNDNNVDDNNNNNSRHTNTALANGLRTST